MACTKWPLYYKLPPQAQQALPCSLMASCRTFFRIVNERHVRCIHRYFLSEQVAKAFVKLFECQISLPHLQLLSQSWLSFVSVWTVIWLYVAKAWMLTNSHSNGDRAVDTLQGVVTYMSPVEAFATAIKFFDRQKVCLIAWSFSSEGLNHLIVNF